MFVKGNDCTLEDLGGGVRRKMLIHGGKMMATEVYFEKGAVGVLHSHPHEQIGYVLYGSFELEEEGVKSILKKGDAYYVAPHKVHGVVALEESALLDIFTPHREDFLSPK